MSSSHNISNDSLYDGKKYILKIGGKTYKLFVFYDSCAENQRDFDCNLTTMRCFRGKYNLGDPVKAPYKKDWNDCLIRDFIKLCPLEDLRKVISDFIEEIPKDIAYLEEDSLQIPNVYDAAEWIF